MSKECTLALVMRVGYLLHSSPLRELLSMSFTPAQLEVGLYSTPAHFILVCCANMCEITRTSGDYLWAGSQTALAGLRRGFWRALGEKTAQRPRGQLHAEANRGWRWVAGLAVVGGCLWLVECPGWRWTSFGTPARGQRDCVQSEEATRRPREMRLPPSRLPAQATTVRW